MEKVNPNGGAIALGHPLAATGTRLGQCRNSSNSLLDEPAVLTALEYMKAHRLRIAVVSLCVGTGMGAAAVLESAVLESAAVARPKLCTSSYTAYSR